MTWLENIRILSQSYKDRDNVIKAFRELEGGEWPDKLQDIFLITSHEWEGDLCIVMQWRGKTLKESKSPLGHRLARAFSRFGQINHSVWSHEIRINIRGKKT